MTKKFRKTNNASPNSYDEECTTEEEPYEVIKGAFLPWWCRNPVINKFRGRVHGFPRLPLSGGYTIQNQNYVRVPQPPKVTTNISNEYNSARKKEFETKRRSAGDHSNTSCASSRESETNLGAFIRTPVSKKKRIIKYSVASSSSLGSNANQNRTRKSSVNKKRCSKHMIVSSASSSDSKSSNESFMCKSRGTCKHSSTGCCVCDSMKQMKKMHKTVLVPPQRVWRDEDLVNSQKVVFDSNEKMEELRERLREDYANRMAMEYMLRLGEMQLQMDPSALKPSGPLLEYMRWRK